MLPLPLTEMTPSLLVTMYSLPACTRRDAVYSDKWILFFSPVDSILAAVLTLQDEEEEEENMKCCVWVVLLSNDSKYGMDNNPPADLRITKQLKTSRRTAQDSSRDRSTVESKSHLQVFRFRSKSPNKSLGHVSHLGATFHGKLGHNDGMIRLRIWQTSHSNIRVAAKKGKKREKEARKWKLRFRSDTIRISVEDRILRNTLTLFPPWRLHASWLACQRLHRDFVKA